MTDAGYGFRQALVDDLVHSGAFQSPEVEAAMRAVPRHVFVPGVHLEDAYLDIAIPTLKRDGVAISSLSQPAIVGIMLEQLALEPGHRVLEIGAGTGYNAALIAHLVGETGHVVTVDIEPQIVEAARQHLAEAGYPQVQVVHADGGYGYPPGAPYDRIIISAAAFDIPPGWWDQLAPEGRIVLPLAVAGSQLSLALVRRDECLHSVSAVGCGFMDLRGEFAATDTTLDIGPDPVVRLRTRLPDVKPDQVYRWLVGPAHNVEIGFEVRPRSGLFAWISLLEPGLASLLGSGEGQLIVPTLYEDADPWDYRNTVGLVGERGACFLVWLPDQSAIEDSSDAPRLGVRAFGEEGEALAHRLIDHMRAWTAVGAPGAEALQIRICRRDTPVEPAPDELLVPKRWTTLAVRWELPPATH